MIRILMKPLTGMMFGLCLALAPSAYAHAEQTQAAESIRAEAAPEDVASVDAIMMAIYDVISGPAGEARDWNRFRSLFIDGARLIPRVTSQPGGTLVWSVEDYINQAGGSLERDGFVEYEIGRTTDQYADIAQIFSAYEAKRNAADPEPFLRGINSFQLLNHDGRWWIVTIYWQSETEETPIPAQYLAP